jgi:hypothetical protein
MKNDSQAHIFWAMQTKMDYQHLHWFYHHRGLPYDANKACPGCARDATLSVWNLYRISVIDKHSRINRMYPNEER